MRASLELFLSTYLPTLMDLIGGSEILTASSVAVIALGAGGYLLVRADGFEDEDWLEACKLFPPGTMIDPSDWHYHPDGIEVLFLPLDELERLPALAG